MADKEVKSGDWPLVEVEYEKVLKSLADLGDVYDDHRDTNDMKQADIAQKAEECELSVTLLNMARDMADKRRAARFFK